MDSAEGGGWPLAGRNGVKDADQGGERGGGVGFSRKNRALPAAGEGLVDAKTEIEADASARRNGATTKSCAVAGTFAGVDARLVIYSGELRYGVMRGGPRT